MSLFFLICKFCVEDHFVKSVNQVSFQTDHSQLYFYFSSGIGVLVEAVIVCLDFPLGMKDKFRQLLEFPHQKKADLPKVTIPPWGSPYPVTVVIAIRGKRV